MMRKKQKDGSYSLLQSRHSKTTLPTSLADDIDDSAAKNPHDCQVTSVNTIGLFLCVILCIAYIAWMLIASPKYYHSTSEKVPITTSTTLPPTKYPIPNPKKDKTKPPLDGKDNILIIPTEDNNTLDLEKKYIRRVDQYLKDNNVIINKPDDDEFVSYKSLFNENVTVIITACKRHSVLSQSIESFEKYNTYSYISAKIVLDDCSNETEIAPMINKYGMDTEYKYTFILNVIAKNKKLSGTGIRSVLNQEYLINNYVVNKTRYYFKSEDDWIFYKYGFLEDSFAIKYGSQYWYNKSLNSNDIIHPRKILSLSLQNLQYPALHKSTMDIHATCGGINNNKDRIFKQYFMSPILGYNDTKLLYVIEQYFHDCFGSYTNRPTLQHIDDFLLIQNKYESYTNLGKAMKGTKYNNKGWDIGNEKLLACAYKIENYALASTVYNGYCLHACSKCHVDLSDKKYDKHFSTIYDKLTLDYEGFTYHCLPTEYYI